MLYASILVHDQPLIGFNHALKNINVHALHIITINIVILCL